MANSKKTDDRPTYVVDTNVLMGAGRKFFDSFSDSTLGIPMAVVNELKDYDGRDEGISSACATVMNTIGKLLSDYPGGQLTSRQGVPIGHDNYLRITKYGDEHDDGGHAAVTAARTLVTEERLRDVTVLSNSLPTRINADRCKGVKASSFKGAFPTFTGWVEVTAEDFDTSTLSDDQIIAIIDDRIRNRQFRMCTATQHGMSFIKPDESDNSQYFNFTNIAIKLIDGTGQCNTDFIMMNRHIQRYDPQIKANSFEPREGNVEQAIALHYLMNKGVSVIFLGGTAGAGKTSLTLAAAMAQLHCIPGQPKNCGDYEDIRIFRSVKGLKDQDIGFLPGTEQEKMAPWLRPIWENVAAIDKANPDDKRIYKAKDEKNDRDKGIKRTDEDKYGEHIYVEPLSYIRGRTFNKSFMIVDDAQSLDRSTILSILSRVGRETKVVFTFDLTQNDNARISLGTSIESVISDSMHLPYVAVMRFDKSERSRIADDFSKMLERGY